jgi:MazG family protein
MSKSNKLNNLLKIIERLRDPINGCPWDKKQTLESIINHSIEEVYKLSEEINKKNFIGIKDELGDLLFQVIYISQITKEKNKFDFNDVVKVITKKMIDRHPHVFKNKKFKNLSEFKNWWEESKNKKNKHLLDNIPKSYPALLKANKIQKKVSEVGFDYKSDFSAIDKVIEEAKELKKELKKKNKKKIKEELGDLLFACLDVSRKLKLNPEAILYKANSKFIKRWIKVESYIKKDKKKFTDLNIKKFDIYWKKAKN